MNSARILLAFGFLACPLAAPAEESWTSEQQGVLGAIERLSATTAPDGEGADAYAEVLADAFSRWTVGSEVISDKHTWVEGVREWFDDGWRVSDRESEYLEIAVDGDYAFVRRLVKETYAGPDKETSTSRAALAEVWLLGEPGWRLLRVEVHPIPEG